MFLMFRIARFSSVSNFTTEQKGYILNLGPCQPPVSQMPTNKFPKTNSYRFQKHWFNKTLIDRSITKDKVFCLYCMLYGKSPKREWTTFEVSK